MKVKKKFQLHRETLRSLDGDELTRAAGASVQQTVCGSVCLSTCFICSCRIC